MVADSANHTPALFVENSGFQFNGYPSMGSWLSYGLGSLAEDLPAFVVLPDGRSGPNGAASNWTNGFLPAEHQGVALLCLRVDTALRLLLICIGVPFRVWPEILQFQAENLP